MYILFTFCNNRCYQFHNLLAYVITVDSKFENMHRDAPPIMPTDTHQGYKQMKAKIGQSRVRPWKWMPFTNPARKVVRLLTGLLENISTVLLFKC